ncbi:hypothetical protein V2G00_000478 [Escherichia coli]|nr:hypothetical protein [Escherichia coli]
MTSLSYGDALTCYGLVSSEVSHLIATLVKRYVVHTENTDLHIPVTRLAVNSKGAIGPLRHMCHMPYITQPETNPTSFDLATRPHRTDIEVRFHVVLPEG